MSSGVTDEDGASCAAARAARVRTSIGCGPFRLACPGGTFHEPGAIVTALATSSMCFLSGAGWRANRSGCRATSTPRSISSAVIGAWRRKRKLRAKASASRTPRGQSSGLGPPQKTQASFRQRC